MMHLTRPKSSKGRSRPAVGSAPHTPDSDSIHRSAVFPDSPVVCSRPDRNLRSQSQHIMVQASQLSQDEFMQMLQHTPAAPTQSLNRYKVLPSIGRRQAGGSPGKSLAERVSKLSLSDDAILQQRHRHEEPDLPTMIQTSSSVMDRRADVHPKFWPQPPDSGPPMTKEAGATGRLLLAIRAPCGRRFEQHFDPTDTLLMVRASAEVRYGTKYGDACIETMDVPRRSFTDMDMTLTQCGILNRSVLCISQNDSVVEQE